MAYDEDERWDDRAFPTADTHWGRLVDRLLAGVVWALGLIGDRATR